ncbi:MAG: tetratricopeptide repeat protein [Planctomycetes bacterium]|nr:tetratricopeptide repeat protein [Planctomycetota bacterium]
MLAKLAKGDFNWSELAERVMAAHESNGEMSRAIGLCENSVMRQPSNWAKYGNLGEMLMKAGDSGRAVRAWRKLAWGEPPGAGPEVLMATLVRHRLLEASARAYTIVTSGSVSQDMRAKLGAGLAELTTQVERESTESPRPDACHALAEAYRARGEWDKAEAAFQKAIQLSPKEMRFYDGLSSLHRERGVPEKAADVWAQAAAANPGVEAYRRLLDACVAADAFDQLAAHWRKLTASADGRRMAEQLQRPLVAACVQQGREGRLLATMQEEVKRNPSSGIGLYRNVAQTYADAGEAVQAIDACRAGLAIAPKDESLRVLLARLYAQRGQLEAAAAEYETLITQNPKKGEYAAMLGEMLLSSGRRDEAIKLWKRMAKGSSDGLSDCLVGDLCLEAGQVEEALAAYHRVVKARGLPSETRARAQFGVARCVEAMGRPGAAVAEYRRVGELFPGTTWVARIPEFASHGTLAATLSEHPQGVLVTEVPARSDAAHDGLRPGDIILKVDGEKLPTQDPLALMQALGRRKPGEKVALGVRRGTRSVTVQITLAPMR